MFVGWTSDGGWRRVNVGQKHTNYSLLLNNRMLIRLLSLKGDKLYVVFIPLRPRNQLLQINWMLTQRKNKPWLCSERDIKGRHTWFILIRVLVHKALVRCQECEQCVMLFFSLIPVLLDDILVGDRIDGGQKVEVGSKYHAPALQICGSSQRYIIPPVIFPTHTFSLDTISDVKA